MRVHAVEDDDVCGARGNTRIFRARGSACICRRGEIGDFARDEVGLIALRVAGVVGDRIADGVVGPESLGLTLAIVLNDGVGGRENIFGRAVVLFELEDLCGWIVALEVEDVTNIGATPTIDRLVLVADDAKISTQ